MSSRTSPLPPGNWWDARSVTLSAEAEPQSTPETAMANALTQCEILILHLRLIVGPGSNGRLHHPVYIREDVQNDLKSVVGYTGTSLACMRLQRAA